MREAAAPAVAAPEDGISTASSVLRLFVPSPPPRGQLVRAVGTGIDFTADPEFVRFQLATYVDKHGIAALDRFTGGDVTYTTPPFNPLSAEPQTDPSIDLDYMGKVVETVQSEVAMLRSHIITFRDDVERRANDTLGLVLNQSEVRLEQERDRYAVDVDKTSLL